jgi:hypothetical protein
LPYTEKTTETVHNPAIIPPGVREDDHGGDPTTETTQTDK